jgi:hypothetical protein
LDSISIHRGLDDLEQLNGSPPISRFLGRNKSGRQLLLANDLDEDASVTFDRRKGGVREPLMMS